MKRLRVLRIVGLGTAGIVVGMVVLVQAQQWVLRFRCERLLKDFQEIRLHQSTWADARQLMTRWGAWGHYEGTCTEADCAYSITLMDASETVAHRLKSEFAFAIFRRVLWLYERLGGRGARMQVCFVVQDGTIWRNSALLVVDVPHHALSDDSYALILSARASPSLHRGRNGSWILGDYAQLAQHPNYIAGRPGGCTFCMSVSVTFTRAITMPELKMISSYDLSCLTRLHPCRVPADVLPVEREWHLYTDEQQAQAVAPTSAPVDCPIPVLARGRDGEEVLVVDVLSFTRIEPKPGAEWPHNDATEKASVRVVEALKSRAGHRPGEVLEITLGSIEPVSYPPKPVRGMDTGKRMILVFFLGREGRQNGLNECSVLPDSPEVRKEIDMGLAQNDVLRRKQEFVASVW